MTKTKVNHWPSILTDVGFIVAAVGVLANMPAAQSHLVSGDNPSWIMAQLASWLVAVLPGIAAKIWQSLKDRGIDVGPVANVESGLSLILEAGLKNNIIERVDVTLKGGQVLPFVLSKSEKPEKAK